MKIASGLISSMVMPRDESGASRQLVTGTCRTTGEVLATVSNESGSLLMERRPCGKASRGRFQAHLDGIPCGGPYTVTLACGGEHVTVGDVLVGELWILAGQSNMEGSGLITGTRTNENPLIRAYYMDDTWGMATEPICCLAIAFAPAHHRLMGDEKRSRVRRAREGRGAGPGLPFAIERFRQTGIPQGLLACAHGGTKIAEWNPADLKKGWDSLYGAMVGRVRMNGGRVTGMLWYQGCSDASAAVYPQFEQATMTMFRALRRDLRQRNLPIVQAQLSRVFSDNGPEENRGWNVVRDAQRLMPGKLHHLLTVPTMDATLDDVIHLDEPSQFILGRRFSEAVSTLLNEPGALPPPIEYVGSTMHADRHSGYTRVTVRFRNVVGDLRSDGRPSGFAFDEMGLVTPHRIELKGNTVILKCHRRPDSVGYGLGIHPYCNITDAAGRSLPAFALQVIRSSWREGVMPTFYQVSEPCYAVTDVRKATPEMAKGLSYMPASISYSLCLYPDRVAYKDKDGVRFFRSRYRLTEAADFMFSLGYDGNIRIFVDGTPVYTDVNARNPVIPGSHMVAQHWEPGEHEVLVAMAMNHGCTWGFSLAIRTPSNSRTPLPEEIG